MMEARTGEVIAQELSFGHSKLTFAQVNHQAMDSAQLQDVSEILNMVVKSGLKTRISSI